MKRSMVAKVALILFFAVGWMAMKERVDVKYTVSKQKAVIVQRENEIRRLQSELDKVQKERNFVCKDVNLAFLQNK